MKPRTKLYACLLLFSILACTGAVKAQGVDPYGAGYDAAYLAGASMMYGTALEAYDALGYSIYGQEFYNGFFDGIDPFYFGQMSMGNTYAGYFQTFKVWWDSTYNHKEKVIVTREVVVKGGTKRVTRSFRSMGRMNRSRLAGDLIQQVSLSTDYSYASVEDKILDGKGHDQEIALFLSGKLGDSVSFGFGYAHDRYDITSNGRGYEQHTGAMDFILSLDLTESLSIGAFVNVSFIDIEDEHLDDGSSIEGDSFERWGFGFLASYNVDLGDSTSLGLTGSIASMNKRSLGRVLDDEDTAGVFMIDLNHRLADNFDVTVHGTYFGLLDRETSPEIQGDTVADGSFWTWGADFTYACTKNSTLSLGYETTASDNDHEEHRTNVSLTYAF